MPHQAGTESSTCRGRVTITNASVVYGTIIVANSGATGTTKGTVSVNDSGNWAEVYFDPYIILQVQQQIGSYRFSRAAYVPCPRPATDPLCRQRLSGNREFGF